MPDIAPFAALRPKPELAGRICEPPYDVLSAEEARVMAGDNPLSFLRVSKPEIELAAGADPYAPEVYARGRRNFQRLMEQGALRRDAAPCFYLYRQVMGKHSQTGVVAVASCADYLQGAIKKHELTRVDKEDDRVRHIEALDAQTGPAFLVYRAQPGLGAFVARRCAVPPEVDFTAPDGIRHSTWTIADAEGIQFVRDEFRRQPCLYIADGHHRTAAAARVFQQRGGAGGSGYFLSVIFPHDQMQILPYNRVLRDLNGLSPASLWRRLETIFEITSPGSAVPARRNQMGFYFQGRWHTLLFRPAFSEAPDPAGRLDVALLQKHVLEPVFGIDNPRTSARITFVGGGRGVAELEKMVESGQHACAFSMRPTDIEELLAVADAGGLMPPKSTWFEPKLRDALFCHLL